MRLQQPPDPIGESSELRRQDRAAVGPTGLARQAGAVYQGRPRPRSGSKTTRPAGLGQRRGRSASPSLVMPLVTRWLLWRILDGTQSSGRRGRLP